MITTRTALNAGIDRANLLAMELERLLNQIEDAELPADAYEESNARLNDLCHRLELLARHPLTPTGG